MLAIITINMALYASATPAQQENNMVLDSSKPTEWIPNKDINTKGDLSLEELKTAVLKSEDIPEFITDEHISKNGHAHRLYQQEEDLNTVVFQNRDGSKTAYVFDEQIKYRDKNGNVRDRSTALTREQNGYRMKDNIVTLFMPNDISTGISLGVDNINITMTPYTFDKKAKVTHSINENDEVTYYGVFGSKTSVKYTPLLSGVKEDIILEEYTDTDSFSFLLTTNGYSVIQSFGKYYLSDPLTGEICGSFGDVIIYDAAGNTATGCMTLKDIETDNKYILTIHADRSFLTSETTQYPVTIDPTVKITNNNDNMNILDTTVYSSEYAGHYGASDTLAVGKHNTLGSGRMYFRFPNLFIYGAITNQYHYITKVELYLYNNSSNTTQNTLLIHKHAGESNWSEGNATCLDIGYHDIGTMLGSTVVSATNQYYSFDITEAFNSWKTNSDELAKGIMIRAQNLSSAEYAKTFASTESDTNKPYVVFTYTDLTPMVCMYHGNLVLEYDEEYTAKATLWIGENIVPSAGQIEFESSKPEIAEIDEDGVIKAKAPGTTTITAKYKYNDKYQCQILVTVPDNIEIVWFESEDNEIDNDTPGDSINLNAKLIIDGKAKNIDENIEYDIIEYISPYEEYDREFSTYVNSELNFDKKTGVLKTPDSTPNLDQYHPTGKIKVKAYFENNENIYITKYIYVVCNSPAASSIYAPPEFYGRYIKINPTDIFVNNSDPFNTMLVSRGLDEDDVFPESGSFIRDTYRNTYLLENTTYSFFDLVRSSEVVFIVTHGSPTSIEVNHNIPNSRITTDSLWNLGDWNNKSDVNKNDIMSLHNGFFSNCKLVFYTSCSGADDPNNSNSDEINTPSSIYDYDGTLNMVEATLYKGAGAVGGFTRPVFDYDADAFEKIFMKYLGLYYIGVDDDGDQVTIYTDNLTIGAAFEAALDEKRNFTIEEADGENKSTDANEIAKIIGNIDIYLTEEE